MSPVVSQPEPEVSQVPPVVVEEKKGDGLTAPAAPAVIPAAAAGAPTIRMLANAVTLEAAAYALIFLLALLTRLLNLGGRTLSEPEATNALAAWQFLQGQATGLIGSPFLFTANSLVFFLISATDTAARLVPALLGSAVVLLPRLLRREIGQFGALLASLLLLLSPSLVYFSREVNGVEISAISGLAAMIWVWRYSQSENKRELYVGALAAALGLTASPAGFTVLLAGGIGGFVLRGLARRDGIGASLAARPYSNGPVKPNGSNGNLAAAVAKGRAEWRTAGLVLAGAYVMLATTFLMNRAGLGAAFNLFGTWLNTFSQVGPVAAPLNLVLVYEPLGLVFGFAGLLLAVTLRGADLRARGGLFLSACALAVSFLFYSLGGVKDPANVVLLTIPLAILAGWFIGNLLARAAADIEATGGWRTALLGELPLAAMGVIFASLIYLQIASFFQQSQFSPGIQGFYQLLLGGAGAGSLVPAMILLIALTVGVVLLIGLLAVVAVGGTRTANLAALLVAFLLFLSGIRALWLANFSTGDPVNEMLAGEQTSLQARDLVQDLEWESEWRANDGHAILVQADPSLGPLVRWYLRGFPNVQWTDHPQTTVPMEAYVTKPDAPSPAGSWVSERYALQVTWQPQNLAGVDLWKWLLFRDGGTETWQYVRLWVPQPQ